MAKKSTKKSAEKEGKASFEEALANVEQIVRQLEEGQLGLSDAVAKYEDGVKQLKRCYEALEKAERKIELLAGVDANGQPITQPFDDEALSLEEKAQSRSRRRSAPSQPPREQLSDDMDTQGGLF